MPGTFCFLGVLPGARPVSDELDLASGDGLPLRGASGFSTGPVTSAWFFLELLFLSVAMMFPFQWRATVLVSMRPGGADLSLPAMSMIPA